MVVVLQGRLRLDLVLELVEHNLARLSLVKLGEHLLSLALSHVEAARLNDPLDLTAVNLAVRVQIKRVKGLHNVKVRMSGKSLANTLGSGLNFEMSAPHVAVLNLGIGEEAIITLVKVVSMIRWSSVQHVAVVRVVREEGLAELLEAQSVVLVVVVALEEEADLISGGEDTDRGQTLSYVGLSDLSVSAIVEDREAVVQVEVGFVSQHNLGALQFSLLSDQVTKSLNQGILVVRVKRGLVRGAVARRRAAASLHWRATDR